MSSHDEIISDELKRSIKEIKTSEPFQTNESGKYLKSTSKRFVSEPSIEHDSSKEDKRIIKKI